MERRRTIEWLTVVVLGVYFGLTFENDPIIAGAAGLIGILLLMKLLFAPVNDLIEEYQSAFDAILLVLILGAIVLSLGQ